MEWVDNTQTDTITKFGVGFTIARPLEPKRLIRMKFAMPPKFRLFDFSQKLYEVWGVVRHLRVIDPVAPAEMTLTVGVALIGAEPPASWLRDPHTLYDINPILKANSFWAARELPRRTGPYVQPFEERQNIETNVILNSIDEKGRVYETTLGKTINLSESGAAVAAKFKCGCPRFVLIKADVGMLPLLAVVRGIHMSEANESYRLHLEFISGKWVF